MNCKYCNKDLSNLKPQQRGGHISNCKLNPNHINTIKKQTTNRNLSKRKNNPVIKINLNCLNCNEEFEIDVIKSYYDRGKYQKCCSKKCANHQSIKNYDDNILKKDICKDCGKEISVKQRTKIGISNCNICKNKLRTKKWKKYKIIKNNKIICKFCGDEKCKRPDVCKRFRSKNNVYVIYLGLNKNQFGSVKIYDEFDKIVDKLKNDYFINELSFMDISKKYKINFQTLSDIFKRLGIKARTLSESEYIAIKNGKINYDNVNPYPYKHGYHITWDNKKVHYRSSYELDYYKKLDEEKIVYEVEKIKLFYFDTQKNKRRIAIPDIYIPSKNLIIEIKSNWTEQNWKDKLKIYKKLKYKVKLVIGKSRKTMIEINY